MTPFAVVTDERTGQKYPLADYALTPSMAIVDTQLVREQCWQGGREQCWQRGEEGGGGGGCIAGSQCWRPVPVWEGKAQLLLEAAFNEAHTRPLAHHLRCAPSPPLPPPPRRPPGARSSTCPRS